MEKFLPGRKLPPGLQKRGRSLYSSRLAMKTRRQLAITQVIGHIPNRLALAGGWIDQPFVSRLNPSPPGSMVVVALKPTFRVMDRSGCASGTRSVAIKL